MPCEPPDDPQDLDEVTALINAAAADPATEIQYGYHADQRKEERQVNPIMVQRALREGEARRVEIDNHRGRVTYRYRFVYEDQYGTIEPVVKILANGALLVITVIRKDRP